MGLAFVSNRTDGSSEYEQSNMIQKRNKLEELVSDHDFTALEYLYYHTNLCKIMSM